MPQHADESSHLPSLQAALSFPHTAAAAVALRHVSATKLIGRWWWEKTPTDLGTWCGKVGLRVGKSGLRLCQALLLPCVATHILLVLDAGCLPYSRLGNSCASLRNSDS